MNPQYWTYCVDQELKGLLFSKAITFGSVQLCSDFPEIKWTKHYSLLHWLPENYFWNVPLLLTLRDVRCVRIALWPGCAQLFKFKCWACNSHGTNAEKEAKWWEQSLHFPSSVETVRWYWWSCTLHWRLAFVKFIQCQLKASRINVRSQRLCEVS